MLPALWRWKYQTNAVAGWKMSLLINLKRIVASENDVMMSITTRVCRYIIAWRSYS